MKHYIVNALIQRFALRRTVVFLLPLLLLVNCKDENLLGLEVQPEGSLNPLQYLDTFRVNAQTVLSEKQRSSQYQAFVGVLNNDVFGRTEASLYLNFRLESENISLDEDPSAYEIDKVTLTIFPQSFYGSGDEAIPIEIYALDEPLDLDSLYPSDSEFRVDDTPLGTKDVQFESNAEIVKLLQDTTYSGIAFDLDKGLGSFLLQGLGSAYINSDQFQKYFNGLMLKPQSGAAINQGAIYAFAIANGRTGISVSYHLKSDPSIQESVTFELASNTSRVNHYDHDFSASTVASYLDRPAADQDLIFVQGLDGVKAKIEIPGLDEFGAKSNLAVNLATLTFRVADEQPSGLEFSPRLYLLDYEYDDAEGDTIETLILDYVTSTNRHGGFLDEAENTYTFDITRQVQKIIEAAQAGEDINFGMSLNAQVPVINQNVRYQNVLLGSDNIVFKLYYTDISQ